MKKIINTIFIVSVNSAVFAGELGIEKHVDSNVELNKPINISYESINEIKNSKYDLDINNSTTGILNNKNIGAFIYYKPEPASLKTNDFLEFHFLNAFTHKDTGNCWLVFDEDKALDTDGDTIPDSMYDLNNDGDFKDLWIIGYTPDFVGESDIISFIISTTGQFLPNNMVLFIGCQDLSKYDEDAINDIDEDGIGNANFDPKYNLILNLNPQDINNKVYLSVLGFDGFGNAIPNLNAEGKIILSYEYQFKVDIIPSVSIINIYSPSKGKLFVQNTSNLLLSSDNTELTASGGKISIDNDSDNSIDDYINLDSHPANFSLKFWSNFYGCTNNFDYSSYGYPALDFNNQRIFFSGDGNELIDGIRFAFIEGSSDININGACRIDNLIIGETIGDLQIPHGVKWKDDIYIGITGNNRLRLIKWQLNTVFEIDNFNYTLFTNSTNSKEKFFLKWEFNGTILWAPQIIGSNDTKVIFSHNNPSKITTAPWSAPDTHQIIEVRAKIWDADEEWCDNILVGTFTDQGRLTLTGKQILNAAKAKCPSVNINTVFSALFTVGAPERDIEATIVQTNSKGLRKFPIYQSKERIDKLLNADEENDIHTN